MFFASNTFWKRTHVGELGHAVAHEAQAGGGAVGGDYASLDSDGALDDGADRPTVSLFD